MTLTLKIKDKSKEKRFVEFLETLDYVDFIEEPEIESKLNDCLYDGSGNKLSEFDFDRLIKESSESKSISSDLAFKMSEEWNFKKNIFSLS